jgi:hypothetical protein
MKLCNAEMWLALYEYSPDSVYLLMCRHFDLESATRPQVSRTRHYGRSDAVVVLNRACTAYRWSSEFGFSTGSYAVEPGDVLYIRLHARAFTAIG